MVTKTVVVEQAMVDIVQKYHGEYDSIKDVMTYLIEKDADNPEVIKGEAFKAFREQQREAYVAYDEAKQQLLDMYAPDVKDKLKSWQLNYKTNEFTYSYEE